MPERPFAAVLGKPIGHSLSPVLHRAGYEVAGLDWEYRQYELDFDDLADFLDSTGRHAAGLSLTMPLKHRAFELARVCDPAALATTACNTLIPQDDHWQGFNTDVPGMVNALEAAELRPATAVVLGAGATAASAVVALQSVGVSEITIAARRLAAARELAARYNCQAATELDLPLPPAELLLSALPAGAGDEIDFPPSVLGLFDVVYAPWPTKLAARAAAAGAVVLGGLELLVEQAVLGFQLMTACNDQTAAEVRRAMYQAGRREQATRSR